MTSEELKSLGERVRIARVAKKMKQVDLADALNVSPPYISNIEQGKQVMSVAVLKGICDTLDVSADWLLRNSSKESVKFTQDDFAAMTKDCTPSELETLLTLLRNMKAAIRMHGSDNIK